MVGGWRSRTTTSVLVTGRLLPARMQKGTSCQRQEFTRRRSATNVSVAESGATPGSWRYPRN